MPQFETDIGAAGLVTTAVSGDIHVDSHFSDQGRVDFTKARFTQCKGRVIIVRMPGTRRRIPPEEKRLSLERDRRNTYGENDKSSRRNIPGGKQRGQMQLRRAVAQQLRVSKQADEDVMDDTAANVADVQTARRHKLFKKAPDTPLGEVLERRRRSNPVSLDPAGSPASEQGPNSRRVVLMRSAAIRAFCEKSSVLNASDVRWGERGGSATTIGKRFRLDVLLEHVPTGVQVAVSAEKEGGHTRAQAQSKRTDLYQLGLRKLEDLVRVRLREARRLKFEQPRHR